MNPRCYHLLNSSLVFYFMSFLSITNPNFFSSVELQKANLEGANSSSSPDDGSSSTLPTPPTVAASPLSSAIPLAQLFAKPGAINALSSLSALGGLTDLLGALSGANQSPPIQTTGVHRPKNYFQRNRSPSGDKTKADRNKFNPYWTLIIITIIIIDPESANYYYWY